MNNKEIANEIKGAFEEGYSSYSTHCDSYTTVDEEWLISEAKVSYDKLLEEMVEISANISDEAFLFVAELAHKNDITFNEQVSLLLKEQLRRTEDAS